MDNNSEQIEKPPPNEEGSVNEANDGVKEVIHNEDEMTALEKVTETTKEIALIDNGASSKPPHKKKLPILTPESKRSLLEHRTQMIVSKEASNLNFLKYLFISKLFLNVARRYPIFCLSAGYQSEDVLLKFTDLSPLKLPIIKKWSKFSNGIYLSHEKMRSLLSMLEPNHFLMIFDDSNFLNETVMKTIRHLDLAPGKIGLTLMGKFKADLSLLLGRFSHRKLEFLQCSPYFLARSKVKLKIGQYIAEFPVNNVQLHKVLSHSLDYFSCGIDDSFIAKVDSDEAASLPSLSLEQCNSLKWLHVMCKQHYASLMEFLDLVKEKCSKLKALRVFVVIPPENDFNMPLVFDADDILNQISYAKGKIQKIVEKCRPLTSSLEIVSFVSMRYDSNNEFSCDWIEKAKTMDWFKDAIHEETVQQWENHAFNVCQLSGKFCDGFLELDHKTMVFRNSPE